MRPFRHVTRQRKPFMRIDFDTRNIRGTSTSRPCVVESEVYAAEYRAPAVVRRHREVFVPRYALGMPESLPLSERAWEMSKRSRRQKGGVLQAASGIRC